MLALQISTMIIALIGVLLDTSVAIVSSIFEISANNKKLTLYELMKVTSLELDPVIMEKKNLHFQEKYSRIMKNEVRYEEYKCEDAEYLLIAFGSSARICQKAIEIARGQGLRLGLIRPITLWPFPTQVIARYEIGRAHV